MIFPNFFATFFLDVRESEEDWRAFKVKQHVLLQHEFQSARELSSLDAYGAKKTPQLSMGGCH